MTTPTQRTLAHLRARGWQCAILERWISYAPRKPLSAGIHRGIRQDVWGWADILACGVEQSPTLVQCTSGAHHAARKDKILASQEASVWLVSGGRILLISWSKAGPRGKRKLWTAREEWISADDFEWPEAVEDTLLEEKVGALGSEKVPAGNP